MPAYELRTFKVDVTPPIGDYLCGGFHGRGSAVENPLFLRGIVLSAGDQRHVVAVIDYCYLVARAQQRLTEALATGAEVLATQVVVQSNHTHAAPFIFEEAHALLERQAPNLKLHNEAYFASVLTRAREAVQQCLAAPGTPIGGIAFASHAVQEFASTRRVLDAANQCAIRWSVCADPIVRDAPEGFIDPLLDAVVFYDEGLAPFTVLFSYACHPQTADRRRPDIISSDTVGVAMELFEKNHPGVLPLHFDGCGGDVTAGKHTTANLERNRLVLGVRLFDAMQEAFNKARPRPLHAVDWVDRTFEVPLRPPEETIDDCLARMKDESIGIPRRVLAAWRLFRLQRGLPTYPFRVTRLVLDRINLLFLPAEMCVEYQVYAKSRCDGHLLVSAYGDSFLNYVATDEAFDQGGYEVKPEWTEVGKGIEQILKSAIDHVLRSNREEGSG